MNPTPESGSGPAMLSSTSADRPSLRDVLEYLAGAANVVCDPNRAETSIQAVERDLPGDPSEQWAERLTRIAGGVGLAMNPVTCSTRAAATWAEPDAPLVAYGGQGNEAGWLVLVENRDRHVRLMGRSVHDEGVWITVDELARLRGVADASERLEWLMPQPAMPADSASPHAPDHGTEHLTPFRRLLAVMRPERQDIYTIVGFAIGIGLLSLATPIAIEALVNSVAFGFLLQPVIVMTVVFMIALSLSSAMMTMSEYVVEFLQRRLFVRMAADFSYRLPRVRLDEFNRQDGTFLVNYFMEVSTVQKSLYVLLLDGITVVLSAVVGMIVLGFYHPLLLMFDVVLLMGILFMVFVLGRGAVSAAIELSRAKYTQEEWLEEMARYPKAFKLARGATFALERADSLAREYLDIRRRYFRIVFRQIIFAHVLRVLALTAILGLGGWLVINRQLTLGQLVASELIVALVVSSLTKVGKLFDSFYLMLAGINKLGHVLDLPLERTSGEGVPGMHGGARLSAHNLTLNLDAQGHVSAPMTWSVGSGERVALVGPSGSGKSQLISMLLGLSDPHSGYIEMDGLDLRDYNLEGLRSQIGLVSQIEIIGGTIADNIRMGRNLGISDLRQALRTVLLLPTVLSMPDGIQTRLISGGWPLSTGQAYRLMIARALVGRPRLLIIDGVLDLLEPSDRNELIRILFDRSAPWTLLVISNQADVLAACDRQIQLKRSEAHHIGAVSVNGH